MNLVSRADLLGATQMPWEAVYLPALQQSAVIVGMSGRERDSFEASLVIVKGKHRVVTTDNMRAKLVARCLFTAPPQEGGTRMFTDAEADALGNVRVDILSPLFSVAQKLSGVTDEDLGELGKLNSESTASGTSSSV